MAEYKTVREQKISKNKIPKWWYAGFEKGFFHGCKGFLKCWFWTYANPIWTIRDKIYTRRFRKWKK